MTHERKTRLFLMAVGLFTAANVYLMAGMVDFRRSSVSVSVFWLAGFAAFTFNLGHAVVLALFSLWSKDEWLPEQDPAVFPKTAILYVVRNEEKGVVLGRMRESLQNNTEANVDLWLLSNSDSVTSRAREKEIIASLECRFGASRVHYFQTRNNPLRRKHVCIREWLAEHPAYDYFLVCDADSALPAGTVRKLVAKAEHPRNRDIALFQSHIQVKEAPTRFVALLGFGQDFCQRLYTRASQKIFGRSVSYGSGCLIRRREFEDAQAPDWALSHDVWETVLLEQKGRRVAFCGDVVTEGSFPYNYLDYARRSRRWIKGTLESGRALFRRGIPLGTRFMVTHSIYMYLAQPLFALWILTGLFFGANISDPLLLTQRYAFLGGRSMDIEMGSHLIFTLVILAGHRFLKCRRWKEAGQIAMETAASILICLNNIVWESLTVLEWLLFEKRGMAWVPMRKSYSEARFVDALRLLWLPTLIGVAGLAAGCLYSPSWTLLALPYLISFVLGIPLTLLTAKRRAPPRE